ncbi:MAG: ThuA domain-containing protein [Kiritimatiellae bacterium]|jgi:hypothetical protein|nr:ThuA domain-containing protein [Kiritimatiellia bacterium]
MRKALVLTIVAGLALSSIAAGKLKALIVDGQNNHGAWPKTTVMMKDYLEDSGMYTVDVVRSKYTWKAGDFKEFLPLAGANASEELKQPKTDPEFKPDFSKYDVVINNFGYKAADWPESTQRAFEEYMNSGGGLAVVHAADNCFPKWKEYNRMIGVGGWGGRTPENGPYVYLNNEGKEIRDNSVGKCGAHGKKNEFKITMRNLEHPITKGFPEEWKTSVDECYSYLRGPAEQMTVLATACDTPALQKAARNEPMLMTINYGKGRVFHTCLGHDDKSCEGVGFIVTFMRGTEWAATGKVTTPVPADFPTLDKTTYRKYARKP